MSCLISYIGIKSGNRRTANVRSLGYADLFALSKDNLWAALEEYPDARKKIVEVGRQILVKDNLIDLVEEEEHHRKHHLFLDQLMRVQEGVASVQLRFASLMAERSAVIYKLKQRLARLERLTDLEDRKDAERAGKMLTPLVLKVSQTVPLAPSEPVVGTKKKWKKAANNANYNKLKKPF